jgi:UDP-glucose-4-epimerase GalE
MRVLVIGGSGYIGSHAVRALVRCGHNVSVYDSLSTGHACLSRGFELIHADIRDRDTLSSSLKRHDAVIHFAAHAYVGESVCDPRKYFDNNSRAALGLFESIVDAGVRFVVFSSTCAVYGLPAVMPITEDVVPAPMNPYGASKLFCEHVLRAFAQAYGIKFAALRYFNAAGADPSGDIGEMHDPETHLIPLALRAVQEGGALLEVFGTDYPTPDGTCTRDYIHVNDLADAHVSALEHMVQNEACLTVNLGTGCGHSIMEILKTVERVTGRKVPVKFGPRRAGDPPRLVADPSLAAKTLGWKSKCDIENIIASAWRWQSRVSNR